MLEFSNLKAFRKKKEFLTLETIIENTMCTAVAREFSAYYMYGTNI